MAWLVSLRLKWCWLRDIRPETVRKNLENLNNSRAQSMYETHFKWPNRPLPFLFHKISSCFECFFCFQLFSLRREGTAEGKSTGLNKFLNLAQKHLCMGNTFCTTSVPVSNNLVPFFQLLNNKRIRVCYNLTYFSLFFCLILAVLC